MFAVVVSGFGHYGKVHTSYCVSLLLLIRGGVIVLFSIFHSVATMEIKKITLKESQALSVVKTYLCEL